MRRAVVSLGSNLGDRRGYLRRAVSEMSERAGRVTASSSVIETPSWGFDSFPFLNQIVVIETWLSPMELLDTLQEIEIELGRTQKSTVDGNGEPVYYARTIDLDILDYDGVRLKNSRLTLPHPHIHDRDFEVLLLKELNVSI